MNEELVKLYNLMQSMCKNIVPSSIKEGETKSKGFNMFGLTEGAVTFDLNKIEEQAHKAGKSVFNRPAGQNQQTGKWVEHFCWVGDRSTESVSLESFLETFDA